MVRVLPPQGELVATPQFSPASASPPRYAATACAGQELQLNWTRVVGNRMTGQGWEEVSKPVARGERRCAGRADFGFDTPDDLGGIHGLWVR